MNLKHISLVSVPVTDQDKARDFYTEMLGFTAEQPGGGSTVGRWFGVDDPDGNNWLITQERDG